MLLSIGEFQRFYKLRARNWGQRPNTQFLLCHRGRTGSFGVFSPQGLPRGAVTGDSREWGLPALGGGREGSHWGSLGLTPGLLHAVGNSTLTDPWVLERG